MKCKGQNVIRQSVYDETMVLEVSGAGELPPCALSEPGVSLSAHRAPIIQPSVVRQTASAETARVAFWQFPPAITPLW